MKGKRNQIIAHFNLKRISNFILKTYSGEGRNKRNGNGTAMRLSFCMILPNTTTEH